MVILCAGCTSGVKIKTELGFGAIIGEWLPRVSFELEIKHGERGDLENQ